MRSLDRAYLDAFRSAVLQGLVTATWVAAGELPLRERRTARLGMVLAMAAAGYAGRKGTETVEPAAPISEPVRPRPEAAVNLDRVVLAATLIPAVTVAPVLVRRRLERHWLAQLRGSGHPHPHRVVAVRFGLFAVVATLVFDLTKAHDRATRGLHQTSE